MTLERLALSRSTSDRAAHRRADPGLLDRLLGDPRTAVLVLDGGRAPLVGVPAEPRLDLLDPAAAVSRRDPGEAVAVFLGQNDAGRACVLLAYPGERPAPAGSPAARTVTGPDADGRHWADLRAVGDLLDDSDAGLLTCAVAAANWHARHPRCTRCGAATVPAQAGWARTCEGCGAEHYPRTDPAVIMAVVDAGGRILLGRERSWPPGRFSTLAGFVEPGESLEAAVRREVFEESGVEVGEVTYRGSQPWPFPSSLMVAFRADATSTEIRVDGQELVQANWWSREELALDVATGELLLPPRVSVSRRLVEDWYGARLTDAGLDWP